MGIEVIKSIIDHVSSWIHLGPGSANVLAIAGLVLIGIVCGAYAVYGVIKLGKLIGNMKIKHLALAMLVTGAALLGIAVLIP